MPINRVPKFVEQRVAERRRMAKSGQRPIDKNNSDQAKKFTSFDAARKQFEISQKEQEERAKAKAERDAKVEEQKKERKRIGKLMNKRNERGQPNMHAQLEVLMNKFNKQ